MRLQGHFETFGSFFFTCAERLIIMPAVIKEVFWVDLDPVS